MELWPIKSTFQRCIDYVDVAGHPSLGASIKGGMDKTSYFRAKCINISKMVGHTPKLLLTNRKLHMHFRLTPRSTTLDDLALV